MGCIVSVSDLGGKKGFVKMFMPVIDEKDCTGCRECAKICPKNVFDPNREELTVADPACCTGCESCIAVCPEAAVKIEEF